MTMDDDLIMTMLCQRLAASFDQGQLIEPVPPAMTGSLRPAEEQAQTAQPTNAQHPMPPWLRTFLAEAIAQTMLFDPQLAALLAAAEEDLNWQPEATAARCQLPSLTANGAMSLLLIPPETSLALSKPIQPQTYLLLAGDCQLIREAKIFQLSQGHIINQGNHPSSLTSLTQPCLFVCQ